MQIKYLTDKYTWRETDIEICLVLGKVPRTNRESCPLFIIFYYYYYIFFLIGWLVSPRKDRLKVYFPFFTAQKYIYFFFFPFMNCSINPLVPCLTLIVVLDPRLFILILLGISALCRSQQHWHICTHWNLLTSGFLSACGRSPVAWRPCTTVSGFVFCWL